MRILLTKFCLDAHDRGVRYVARKLMEAEMEVIYIMYHVPEEIVNAAIQEDVDCIGISFSTGGYMATVSKTVELLKDRNMGNIKVMVGGIIPDDDMPGLLEMGVIGVFGPGSNIDNVVNELRYHVGVKSNNCCSHTK